MRITDIEKYRELYKSAEAMGAAKLIRAYLKLDREFVIPLSISHGVDMNHCSSAMDVDSIEPIHWSCSQFTHERALKVKPSLRLPHPWLMIKATRSVKAGERTLIIGPPPGRQNDENLLQCLKGLNIDLNSCDLLLKYRGETDLSRNFWITNGINVVSAGYRDYCFYERLFDLIESYECVIGCTLSSAIFFAASIDKKCSLIEDYFYSAYDTVDYLGYTDFTSKIAQNFVNSLKNNQQTRASSIALNVLGQEFLGNTAQLRQELVNVISELKSPFHFAPYCGALEKKLISVIAKLTGRSGLIRYGIRNYLKNRRNPKISIITINEISVWIDGVNTKNFKIKEVPYVKNKTEPGWATD